MGLFITITIDKNQDETDSYEVASIDAALETVRSILTSGVAHERLLYGEHVPIINDMIYNKHTGEITKGHPVCEGSVSVSRSPTLIRCPDCNSIGQLQSTYPLQPDKTTYRIQCTGKQDKWCRTTRTHDAKTPEEVIAAWNNGNYEYRSGRNKHSYPPPEPLP